MVTKENLEIYVKANILAIYDVSVKAREKHDLESEFNNDGVRIKCTREERIEYIKKLLESDKI